MKILVIISFFLIPLISCNVPDKTRDIDYSKFIEKEFKLVGIDKEYDLKDSIGTVFLKIPSRLDTFYQWHRTSDCLPCGRLQYRFADKEYPQFAEGGFYWTVVPDSVYQLTISHNPIRECPDSFTLNSLVEKDKNTPRLHQVTSVSYSDSVNYLFKQFKIINNRAFLISAFLTEDGYLTESQTLFIVAATTLKDRNLFFIGECGAKDTIGFIDNMHKSFLSIRIKEKP